jgi:hypothetical protein
MHDPNLIDDPERLATLRRLTAPVPLKELMEYVHYDHVDVLRETSHRLGLFILLRRTNPESIKYVGWQGFVPKPLACKPKTAKTDARLIDAAGRMIRSDCAGLVVDPRRVGASAFDGSAEKHAAAIATWDKYWAGGPPRGFAVQEDTQSGYFGCVMRCGEGTQVFPSSRTAGARLAAESIRTGTLEQPGALGFQLLPEHNIDRHALSTLPKGCSYIHGDYDLYALVHKDRPGSRMQRTGSFDGEGHVHGEDWRRFEALVRSRIGIDMIQHGSQEHFSDHTDEPVDMFCPTIERELWHVKIDGAQAMERVYAELFGGRAPAR